LIWIKTINQQKSAHILLSCTELHNPASRLQQSNAQRLEKKAHLHQCHNYMLCCIRLLEKYETTTADVGGNSAPCTADPVKRRSSL